MRGKFITLEGGEGVGKSTQSRLLADALAAKGIETDLTREPGGTGGAEAIRELILHHGRAGRTDGWHPRAEALLFAAARADHVEWRIRPALDAGTWVICDRFIDSTRAYQGGGGGLADEDLLELHRIGSGGLMPDMTLLIEVPASVTAERVSSRNPAQADNIEGRNAAYHAKVAQAFARIAAAEPRRFVRIDGSGSLEQTHQRIMDAIAPLLGESA